ncbi:phage tail protein [Altererythrobacter sp. MF3-039]|uniref:phage tail protein n=1 Tax=Altererythrobacter sp. MF3-039 TaxID=3252901 RepID=UPI00390C7D35
MATLLLTAVGTAFGGPIGGAIGAIAGQQIDSRVLGSRGREGPRLKELSVTTSSYGQPIARHYGSMRAAGTVIWSTNLKEQRETSGGGKGKPKTTSYSYSVSFAVALSSNPIDSIGRIWADGNLLRGAAGDLKTGGKLRIYKGWGDQPLDPLLYSAEGGSCPAFRNTAYVVFEDLQLGDFGNRIPALSFEVLSGAGNEVVSEMLGGIDKAIPEQSGIDTSIGGFSWEGGTLGQTLEIIDSIYPISASTQGANIAIGNEAELGQQTPAVLTSAASAWEAGDFGEFEGYRKRRDAGDRLRPDILRYYDPGRDYQPGTQRAIGRAANAQPRAIEFPGTLTSGIARGLIDKAATDALQRRELLSWRAVELDPAVRPGSVVTAPGFSGAWRVEGWEWREGGIELELVRLGGAADLVSVTDPGRSWSSPDLAVTPTILRAFELPFETTGQLDVPIAFAATMSEGAGWPGASIFAEIAGELISTDRSSRTHATGGILTAPLAASSSVRSDLLGRIDVEFYYGDTELQSASLNGLAFGANRLLVGSEIIQFAQAEKIDETNWRLSGLLRGRGGTESPAALGHALGASVTLLDDRLLALENGSVTGADQLAAIGPADFVPAYAPIENVGLTRKPPTPVHPRQDLTIEGSVCFTWTRRARGAWVWIDEVDVPLVEQSESYRVGLGPAAAPFMRWETSEPILEIDAAQWAVLQTDYLGEQVWVRQIGSHAQSDPLLLGSIS